MNTRTIDPRTLWAVLAMEAGIALPIISLPSQGDRMPGLYGPLLLMLLLPLGFIAVRQYPALRDPSWRLLTGIGAALLTRAIVSMVPAPGLPGLAMWLARSVVPAAIGVGLWWRGGGLWVAELTASEVRAEFAIVAACTLAMLALVRPFVLTDQVLLGSSVGLVMVGGLLATTFARQDAAATTAGRSGRGLAAAVTMIPVGLAVILGSVLQPALLDAMWTTLGRILGFLLTPVGWFFYWLGSFFPRTGGVPPPLPPQRPLPNPTPDPTALADLQERTAWIGTLVLFVLILAAGLAALLIVRVMLENWLRPVTRAPEPGGPAVTVESSGTPRADAVAFWAWLRSWLRRQIVGQGHLGRRRRGSSTTRRASGQPDPLSVADAWSAYRQLLEWAAQLGQPRHPAETTGQLQARLTGHTPDAAEAVGVVTSTYEAERYGEISPPPDRLRRLRDAIATLKGIGTRAP